MSKELKQIGNEVLQQIKSSPYFTDMYENSLKNIRDTVLEINKRAPHNNIYNEENILSTEPTTIFDDNSISIDRNLDFMNSDINFKDTMPPQIRQRSAQESAPLHPPAAIQRPITPIFNQTSGNNVDSLIAQASQVPFLYHNQQL